MLRSLGAQGVASLGFRIYFLPLAFAHGTLVPLFSSYAFSSSSAGLTPRFLSIFDLWKNASPLDRPQLEKPRQGRVSK